MDNEKILDKIQKLLRLSTSNNINESAAAAGAAQRLMHKYNLTMLMVESYDGKILDKEEIIDYTKIGQPLDFLGKNISVWKSRLALVISEANHCRVYINTDQKGYRCVGLVGTEKDTSITRYLYHYLINKISRLSERDGKGKGKTWCNNFKIGAVSEIKVRLDEALEQSKITLKEECKKSNINEVYTTTALMKFSEKDSEIEDFMKQLNLRKGPVVHTNFLQSANEAGRKAAREINLNDSNPKLEGMNDLLEF